MTVETIRQVARHVFKAESIQRDGAVLCRIVNSKDKIALPPRIGNAIVDLVSRGIFDSGTYALVRLEDLP